MSTVLNTILQLVSKLLPAPIGCKARGSALSAKKVLDVLQHASEPFPPPALATSFSLDFAAKPGLKPVVVNLVVGQVFYLSISQGRFL